MKITKIALIGLMALSSAAYAGAIRDTASEAKNKSLDFAQATWMETKRVTRTVVDSPVIAYHVVRGDRPLFTHDSTHRESMALAGHRVEPRNQKPSNRGQEPPVKSD
ncbi:MAG TPA: hypothetical protein VHY22_07600 [Chthoniobacteraceae bacterium]|jgi:hypothetical protein|nr:hypothetical protein [Chthoniobacteraceae bacterium]